MRHLPAPPIGGGALLAVLLITGCNSGEDAAAPSPSPSLTTQAVPTASADGQPLSEGEWSIEETATGATASFGSAGSEPLLRIVCDRDAGAVTLIRIGIGDEAQIYTIEAGAQRAAVQMSPSATGVPAMLAEIDPTQPIFAAFSDPAQTIEISGPDAPALRMPGRTGINRVMQACS
jgi:hypothetical protein